jgi:FkbM family methyltransferase
MPDKTLMLQLEHSSIKLPKNPVAYQVLSGYSLLYDLEAYTSCQVVWDEQNNALALHWGDSTYLADGFEEIYTLWEIFFSGDYDFTPADSTVVVDVGANVGFTSIFLADINPELVAVAYEPVPESYSKACRNLEANPHLSWRVNFHNFALFSEDGKKTITSEVGNRVRSSFVIDHSNFALGKMEPIPVEVRRASTIIREVRDKYPSRRIVIKMDCEGSEYDILRNLETDGALNLISGFIMEWHTLITDGDNAIFVRNFFERNGFDLCMRGRLQSKNKVGMAYAFRVTAIL